MILLCPFWMRQKGIIVDNFPHRFESEDSIRRNYIVYHVSGIKLILMLSGVISCLLVRTPIQEEIIS